MSETDQKISRFIRQLFYLLFFFTPLLLWPFTSEVFEFNKMLFVYFLTILIASSWLARSFINHKFEIVRTPLDTPLFLFLISQTVSTFISINPHTSLWGYYSRFHGGLMSTISYIVLFYALVTHFRNQANAIKNLSLAILSSAALISSYAILEHFGIDKNIWVQDVQNRVFSTLGQPNWLSAFLIALLPLSLFPTINHPQKKYRFVYGGLSLLSLFAIVFTKSQSGLGATAVILFLFFVIISLQNKKPWLLLTLIPLVALIFTLKGSYVHQTLSSLNKINPFYSDTLSIISEENKTRIGGSDSMTIRRVVWEGALKLGLTHPFFGTGVETFAYSYYGVRPAAHNLTSEADFLYNKAHNEYLNFLANTGFVGLLTYLLLIICIIKILGQKNNLPLFLGFFSILITNYFGFSVVNIALFFFLYPAIALANSTNNQTFSLKLKGNTSLSLFILASLTLWLLFNTSRAWLADIAYNRGKSSFDEAQKAVSLNPQEPLYFAQLGNINALIATQIIAPKIAQIPATASAEIKQQAQDYLHQYQAAAIENINKAAALNPYNLNILKTKAKTELILATINPQYYQDALTTLLQITALSPTENTNFYNVGILYQSLGNTELAKIAFQKALELNPNYTPAQNSLKQLHP